MPGGLGRAPGAGTARQRPGHRSISAATSHRGLASARSWPCPPPSLAPIPLGCVAGMHSPRDQHGCQLGGRWGRGALLGEAVPPRPWPPQAWAVACHIRGAVAAGAALQLRARLRSKVLRSGLQLRHVCQPLPPAAPLRHGSHGSPSCHCHGLPRAPCVARPCATLWLKSPVEAKTGSSSPARSLTSWHLSSLPSFAGLASASASLGGEQGQFPVAGPCP